MSIEILPTLLLAKKTKNTIKKIAASKRLISIIILTLNQQFGIEKTTKSIPKSLIRDKLAYETEIIMVDGDSIDSTQKLPQKWAHE